MNHTIQMTQTLTMTMNDNFNLKPQQRPEEILKDKIVLVTGGTGSFGNAVVERLSDLTLKRIIIFSRDEKKQNDMRNYYNNPLLKFIIGDVRDKESLDRIMEGVDYIFHAAALKQVPSCEFFPLEAIKTNIFGAQNVIELAEKHNVKRLVILSTDKAAYPINVMGMTKALMEKIMIAASRRMVENNNQHTIFCGTRYGNVLYTRGSVLPHFVETIKQNKPLTLTNGKMTRFLLPLPQSVDLVLYALTKGENGDMYIRKSPATTMEILAQAVCEIFNHKPGYQEVGIRAGEKMHETLITREEMVRAQDQGNYYRIPSESQGLEYQKYFEEGKRIDIDEIEPFTSSNTRILTREETIELLLTLPEIQHEQENFKRGEAIKSAVDSLLRIDTNNSGKQPTRLSETEIFQRSPATVKQN